MPRRRRQEPESGDALVEFHRVGDAVKVSAIDPETGTEVSITGPVSAGQWQLAETAVRKLRYVLARRRRAGEPRKHGKPGKGGAGSKRGVLA